MEAENNSNNTILSEKNESLVGTGSYPQPAICFFPDFKKTPVDFKKELDTGATRRKLRSESIKKAISRYREKKETLREEFFDAFVDGLDEESLLALRAEFYIGVRDLPKTGLKEKLEKKFGVSVDLIPGKEETIIVFNPK